MNYMSSIMLIFLSAGTVRDILKLQPFEVVEVNAGIYSNYEVCCIYIYCTCVTLLCSF